jgi:hypothetical protein
MRLVLVLAVAAALGLTACGAGDDEAAPAESTETSEPEQVALPDVARVVCAVHGTRLETDTVKPQPDGVHVEVVNETGEERSVSVLDPQGAGMGQSAPAGTSTLVVALAPGALEVTCSDLREEEREGSMLQVVDEDGVWISTTLDCMLGFSGTSDYTPDARGDADPLTAAQSGLESYMQPGDVVEPAGYPEAETPLYRLMRDGEVLATVELMDDGHGGWLPSTVEGCSTLTD